MGIVVKFSTLAGGSWIEEDGNRVFRFDDQGRAEWAEYADLMSNNPAPRWYGFQSTIKDFILC